MMPEKGFKIINFLIKKETEQLKSDVHYWAKTAEVRLKEIDKLREENEHLEARLQYLETKIQRERNATKKQYEKWEKEAFEKITGLEKENAELLNSIVSLRATNDELRGINGDSDD